MISTRTRFLFIALLATMISACNKTVTNNVPASNHLTPETQVTVQNGTTATHSEAGGVINGGGGKGVRCTKNGKTTVEVLDLYEAKSIYNLSIKDFGSNEETAKEKLAEVLARHFWNPYSVEMAEFTKAMKQTFIQEFFNNIRFIDEGKTLRLTNDSFEPTIENGCEPVQVAMYYDESVLLIDKALWTKMDWTNKMGLIAHEALYFLARQSGTKNSMTTRKLVGMLFSEAGVTPIADGLPTDTKKFLNCHLTAAGFSKGYFNMYSSKNAAGENGLQLIFFDLGNEGSLFRTSSFIENLSFLQLQNPKFASSRQALLVKDTYPNRDQISLTFKGISDRTLKADLRLLLGAGSTVSDTSEVSCYLPAEFDALEPKTTEPGEFEHIAGDGSIDQLIIKENGGIVLEQTRQLGGPGGISNAGVVPYPTVCRYKEFGLITKQDEKYFSYVVISGELGNLEGLKDTEHCKDYIDAFNRRSADSSLSFSIKKSEFTKIK